MDLHIVGQSASGRATVKVLQLNRPERVGERICLARVGLWAPPANR
jgi:hypothetical protein